MKKVGFAFAGIGFIVLAAVVLTWVVPRHDALIQREEMVKKEWAQIEVMLERRYDLIPNLVTVAERFATDQEKDIIKDVTDAAMGYRSADDVNGKIKAARRTEGALRNLLLWGRLYPQLASSSHFLNLSRSLERTEELLSQRRMTYNDAVSELSSMQRSVAGRVANWVAGVPAYEYYSPDEDKLGDFELRRDRRELDVHTSPARRTSGPPQASEEAATPSDPASAVRALRLQGVLTAGDAASAVVSYPDGRSQTVVVGDRVPGAPARVIKVTSSGATLELLDDSGRGLGKTVRLTVN